MPSNDDAASTAIDASFFSALEAETSFLLIRHGQSEGNARNIMQGRLDLPLDGQGRAQARSLAPWLAGRRPDLLVASPLARARETAELAAPSRDGPAPLLLEPLLAELETGVFTGLTFEESARDFPEAWQDFRARGWDGVPGAEDSGALYARALEAWKSLRAQALRGSRVIAVFSHGGFLQWLLKATFGGRSWMPLVPMANCGVSELVVTPQGAGTRPLLSWVRVNQQVGGLPPSAAPLF